MGTAKLGHKTSGLLPANKKTDLPDLNGDLLINSTFTTLCQKARVGSWQLLLRAIAFELKNRLEQNKNSAFVTKALTRHKLKIRKRNTAC